MIILFRKDVKRRPQNRASVEYRYPALVCLRVEAQFNLLARDLLLRQRVRDLLPREVAAFGRFEVFLKLSADERAEHEDFHDSTGIARRIMPVSILHGNDSLRLNGQSRFLENLLGGVLSDGLVHVAPSARQRPAPTVFAHQQDFSLRKHSGAGIHLWRLIAGFIAEQTLNRFKRQIRGVGEHFRRKRPNPLIAFKVVPVAPIGQPGLRKALQFHNPVDPLLFVQGIFLPLKKRPWKRIVFTDGFWL